MVELRALAAKHEGKQTELLGDLEKSAAYLLNNRQRQAAGKVIGSGRMEKQIAIEEGENA